jgi:ABC-2 type transport system ATP-binding protein
VVEGDIVVVFGPEGSGKTNLLESIVTQKNSDMVKKLFADPQFLKGEGQNEQSAYLPRHFEGFPQLTVRENISIMARLFSNQVDLAELISRFNLQLLQRARLRQLTKGEKRRVGIASTLVNDPKFVVLDEPSLNLSTTEREEIGRMIRLLANDHRIVIVSTRYREEAEDLANFLVIMHKGKVLKSGSRQEVMPGSPTHRILVLDEISSSLPQDFLMRFPNARVSGNSLELETANLKEIGEVTTFLAKRNISGNLLVRKKSLADLFVLLAGVGISPEGELK